MMSHGEKIGMAMIERENLNTKVHILLKEMILNARFEPGARVNVEQLAREMGVSRTPVWEAIRRLEHEGLLVNEPNRGVFMKSLDPEEACDLYAVREVLEGMAARIAAERLTEDGLRQLEESLEEQQKIAESGDVVEYSHVDFRFHAIIYEASGNIYLKEQLENIKNKMRPLGIHFESHLPLFVVDHMHIVEALRLRDAERSEEEMRKHNRRMMAILKETGVAKALSTAD
jgi:DNA-binding GntR family transcriptional regulator